MAGAAIASLQEVSSARAAGIFGAFCAYQATPFAAFAAATSLLRRSDSPSPNRLAGQAVLLGAWWIAIERGFPRIIPWHLGDALAPALFMRQLADLGGVYGLSWLIVAINGLVAISLSHMRGTLRVASVGCAAASLSLVAAYGTWRVWQQGDGLSSGTRSELSVAVVQGGLPSDAPTAPTPAVAWQAYADLTDTYRNIGSLGGAIDLFVWPETAVRTALPHDRALLARSEDLVMRLGVPLLLGALDSDGSAGEINAAYLLAPSMAARRRLPLEAPTLDNVRIYHKARLLPFGEYVPGAQHVPLLRGWRTTGRFRLDAARARGVFRLASRHDPTARIMVAPSICFEAVYPGELSSMVREGATVLVNITDDGWFGDTFGPRQHFRAASLRAVETRRWLVRASNSGVSALIDPLGRVVASLPYGASGVIAERIALRADVSPYVQLGNWPIMLALALVVASALARLVVWHASHGDCVASQASGI